MDRFCLECNNALKPYYKKFCSQPCYWRHREKNRERWHLTINPEIHEILEGVLLSDGNLEMQEIHKYPRLRVSQSEDHLEYLKFLCKKLNISEDRIKFRPKKHKKTGKVYNSYSLDTLFCPELLDYYNRWYRDGVKILPKDFQITPVSLLHEYLGDGCLAEYVANKKYGKQVYNAVYLYLMNFTQEENERFVELLKAIGVDSSFHMKKNCPIIKFGKKKSLSNFFSYLYKNEVNCYNYKFDYRLDEKIDIN